MHAIFHRILAELDLSFLTETIYVIAVELISNFQKAVAKRIFFAEQQLDINNYHDYVSNIGKFKSLVLDQWDKYPIDLEKSAYRIYFDLILSNEYFIFYIENNVKVTIFEKERIEKRLLVDETQYIDFYNDLDFSEGGGLGLFLIKSLIVNSGIGLKNFKIEFRQDSTIGILRVPLKLNKPSIETYLRKLILNKVDTLPSYPDHLQELIKKCDDGEVAFDYIVNKIIRDPGLTSQIIRLASSAGYITRNKNPDLKLSISLIGLRQLKHLLMIYATKNVFSKIIEKKQLEEIWFESNRIAYFSQRLQKLPELKEINFIIGILNLIGKLVIYSLDNKEIQRIRVLSKNRATYSDLMLEELEIGITYPEVGAVLAELWKFPDNVIYGIRYQMKPLQISEDKIPIVYPVYLAKCMNEILCNRLSYDFIEYRVLKYFDLWDRKDEFLKLCETYDQEFRSIYVL
ncbi:MAG: HDOD domain-containing protein [Leptospiraceae bacterium]|nr:HDOD domain-containing protein [Leptospiraceae bacterium]